MGLFNKSRTVAGPLTPPEGVAAIAFCAMAADGVAHAEEIQVLGSALSRMRLFREMRPREVNDSFEKVLGLLQEVGRDELARRAAEAVPADLRPTAYAIAADLVFADGEFGERESRFLEDLGRALDVPQELAQRVLDVMAIKNAG